MGGVHDSSRTRVAPVFSALQSLESPWVGHLLALTASGAPDAGLSLSLDAQPTTVLFGGKGRKEKRLLAPSSLLRWLVQHVEQPTVLPTMRLGVRTKREALFARHANETNEALRKIDEGLVRRGWHVLEGPTAPDVYIETADALIVIEGKRTEAGPTTDTTWMPGRHQMWRHIDAAWEVRGRRQVYGFFIVEGAADGRIPQRWQVASQNTWSDHALSSSLPHRTPEERAQLRRCFLGVTTWQRVVREFGLPATALPMDRAEAERP